MSLIIPKYLKKWSKVAIVTLSWWWPWEYRYRYEIWIKQLKNNFWVEIVEMENTFKSAEYIYYHPEKRAEDLMKAFLDPSIDAIFSSIGWDDSIRILPYIDFEVIKNNPKIFLGYSDSTIIHFICYKAWIRSYYWPSIMAWFAENWWLYKYMKESVEKTLFSNNIIWEIKPNKDWWTDEFLDWADKNNQKIKRKLNKNDWWHFLQWRWIVKWNLLWWCIDVFSFMWWTKIWPKKEEWKWKILFIETSEENMSNQSFERILRTMWVQWILENLSWIIMGRAQKEKNYDESILKIVNIEFWLKNLPIITNMDFWHTDPMFTIPIWAEMILNFENKKVFINESWVI